MKTRTPEYTEGPQAFKQFTEAMQRVLRVPHAVIQQRIERERAEAAKKAVRPGPKRKSKNAA